MCLGTLSFGLQSDVGAAQKIMGRAADAGIDFFDTADVYPALLAPEDEFADHVGRAEEIVGDWVSGRRDEYVIATKFRYRTGPGPNQQGAGRRHIMAAVEASLRRLRSDWIDLYQLHAPDPDTPIDETLSALDSLVRSGKVRYIGCSNFLAYQLAKALGRSEVLSLARFDSVQPRYNLLFREAERELLPLCAEDEVGVLAFNPLAGGLLTGRHDRGRAPDGDSRFALGQAASIYRIRYWRDAAFDAVAEIGALAGEAGLPPATLAVAWVMANPAVTAPVIGASRPEQLTDTLAAADVVLDDGLLSRLDRITRRFRWGDAVS
ncbi:aldo/keto reductase [Actinophytocola oryzae]|nr:aldo/keto reductase [Actinophytocola oryzae]